MVIIYYSVVKISIFSIVTPFKRIGPLAFFAILCMSVPSRSKKIFMFYCCGVPSCDDSTKFLNVKYCVINVNILCKKQK